MLLYAGFQELTSDMDQTFSCRRKKGGTSVVITGLMVAFVLKYVGDRGIFELLWQLFLVPHYFI